MSKFKGSYVALVTPFKNGKVDAARLKWLVDYQIDQGTEGLVPLRFDRRIGHAIP